MYILLHIRLCGRVSDNKIFTRPISGNKTFFYGLTCCFCLKYFLVLKGVGITKVIEWQFIFSSSKRLLLVKEVSNGSGQNLLATKYKTLYMIENFIYLFYDSMYIGFYALYRLVITGTFFVSLTFHILLVSLQLCLTNLQNVSNFDILATKTEDPQLTKMVFQVLSIHLSRLLCF